MLYNNICYTIFVDSIITQILCIITIKNMDHRYIILYVMYYEYINFVTSSNKYYW